MVIRSFRTVCAAVMLAALAVIPATWHNHASAASPSLVGPKRYYLALGDGLAYGYQPNRGYAHGYADTLLKNYLQALGTRQLINLACAGETSVTMINGGCPASVLGRPAPCKLQGTPFADYCYGPTLPITNQLSAAVKFIKDHPGQVSPVTIDIGANDIWPDISPITCTASPSFVQDLSNLLNNYPTIMSQLDTALGGTYGVSAPTKGDLAILLNYDPLENNCPQLTPTLTYANYGPFVQIANLAGASTADGFAAFGGDTTNGGTTDNPNPKICLYTWMNGPGSAGEGKSCDNPPNAFANAFYPNTLGYHVLALGSFPPITLCTAPQPSPYLPCGFANALHAADPSKYPAPLPWFTRS